MRNPTPFDAVLALAHRLRLDVREGGGPSGAETAPSDYRLRIDRVNRVAYVDRRSKPTHVLHDALHLYCDPPGRLCRWNEHHILMPVERAIARDLFPNLVNEVIEGQEQLRDERFDPFENEPWWPESVARAVRVGLLHPATLKPTYAPPDWSSFSKEELDALYEEIIPAPYTIEVYGKGRWHTKTVALSERWATIEARSASTIHLSYLNSLARVDARARKRDGTITHRFRARAALPLESEPTEPEKIEPTILRERSPGPIVVRAP
jgi:hypothetical protein